MLCTVESDFSVPETTRNIVMRPANGSAIVFQTNAAARRRVDGRHGDVVLAAVGRCAVNGRSAGDGT